MIYLLELIYINININSIGGFFLKKKSDLISLKIYETSSHRLNGKIILSEIKNRISLESNIVF